MVIFCLVNRYIFVKKAAKLLRFLLALRRWSTNLADRIHNELLDPSTDNKLVDRLNRMVERNPFPVSGEHFIRRNAMVMRKLIQLILQHREEPIRHYVTDQNVAGKVKCKTS